MAGEVFVAFGSNVEAVGSERYFKWIQRPELPESGTKFHIEKWTKLRIFHLKDRRVGNENDAECSQKVPLP